MKVILAGYNVDSSVLKELKSTSSRADITPEILSAAYARISRDARPVDELRAVARREVEKAKRSNQNIIFKMGHHSVAEHAVFNFDIIGISRLATEELEKFRLCSYTEKSQRYISLKDDFVIPEEIRKAGMQKIFVKTIREQNDLYHKLYKKLRPHMFNKNSHMATDKKNHKIIDGWAKEDARYGISLATEGQLGMTVNARNLEYLIRRFASKSLTEVKEIKEKLYKLAKKVAPSIILFTEANDFDSRTYPDLEETAGKCMGNFPANVGKSVELVDFSSDADLKLVAALIHTSSSNPYSQCLEKAKSLSEAELLSLIKTTFKHMEFFDAALREFEFIDVTFDLIISATCFAQLKRHRMATLTTQNYNPYLGVTIPASVEEIGMRDKFLQIMEKTNDVYLKLQKRIESGAEYVLTNAHKRRVLFKINARELYHFSRLREDATAQWDIREIAAQMCEAAKNVMPKTCLMLGGKDVYPEIYKKIFKKAPKLKPFL